MRLSPAQIATIEFENDGKFDSLTSTLAPSHFFELVERESAIAERAGAALLLISVKLDLERYFDRIDALADEMAAWREETEDEETEEEIERFSPAQAIARIERYIINLSETISENLRAGDFFSRYSDTGFLILLRGSEIEFHLAQKRFSEIIIASERSLELSHSVHWLRRTESSPAKSASTKNASPRVHLWMIDSIVRERGESRFHLVERIDRLHFN